MSDSDGVVWISRLHKMIDVSEYEPSYQVNHVTYQSLPLRFSLSHTPPLPPFSVYTEAQQQEHEWGGYD